MEASLVKKEDDHVVLRRSDGGMTKIAIEKLSDRDKQYLKEFDVHDVTKANSFKLSPPKPKQWPAMPILDLPAATVQAADGSDLQLSLPIEPQTLQTQTPQTQTPQTLPKAMDADRSPWTYQAPDARIPIANIDIFDNCSRAIPLGTSGKDDSPRATSLAMSLCRGINAPGARPRSALVVFEPHLETAKTLWTGESSIRLLDHHQGSRRGLVLLSFDSLGKGGQFAIASGWEDGKVTFSHRRSVTSGTTVDQAPRVDQAPTVDQAPHVRWARWVDEEHFIAVIDETIGMWNIVSGQQLYRIREIDRRALPTLSGGRRYVAIPNDESVDIRRTTDGVSLGRIPLETSQIAAVSFSPQGDAVAIATSRRFRVWDLTTSKMRCDVKSRHSLGKRSPIWINDDLVLSSTGVLLSVFRSLPIWRYEMAGVKFTSVGNRVALLRKSPQAELNLMSIPHSAAEQAMQWIDESGGIAKSDPSYLPGRSVWLDGQWSDRDLHLSYGGSKLR